MGARTSPARTIVWPLPGYTRGENHCGRYGRVTHGVYIVILLLFTGGVTTGGSSSASVYALAGTTWTTIKQMENSRAYHSCSIINNRLVVLGGLGAIQSVETLDFEKNSWSAGPGLTTKFDSGFSVVDDGQLYAVYGKGEVMRMAEDRNTWDKVADVGGWGVGGWRPFHQAVRVTKQMIGC